MIFSEIYSVYYTTISHMLKEAVDGNLNRDRAAQIVQEYAFSESALTILPALQEEKWKLFYDDFTTPIRHVPEFPLTTLEKMWLKSMLLDPRVQLFDLSFDGLEDVEPLFTQEDYILYDRYVDGDPYSSSAYQSNFRVILKALRQHYPLEIDMFNRNNKLKRLYVMPHKLEYSEKDDKFRLITTGNRFTSSINLARILDCRRYYGNRLSVEEPPQSPTKTATLLLTDQRNALERVMLHFAHFQKQAERIDDTHYLVKINYNSDDETELVIRILSFGSNVLVKSPSSLVNSIKNRLLMQKNCGLR